MSFLKDDITGIKAFLFDVDGVLSEDVSSLDRDGDPVRTSNVKDGYAIRCALSAGYIVGIITGGTQKRVELRYRKLGVRHFYDNSHDKVLCLNDFLTTTGIDPVHVLYMGDDQPDFPVMIRVGLSACPADAIPEIKAVSGYISDRKGGRGCVRDVIEQVMRAQDTWTVLTGGPDQGM